MTSVYGGQAPSDLRQIPRYFNDDGSVSFAQLGFQELDFSAIFGGRTTSTTQADIALGLQQFTLDYDDGRIGAGCSVQITSLQDVSCWMYGLVTKKDTSTGGSVIDVVVSRVSDLTGAFWVWDIQIIGGPVVGLDADTTAVSSTTTSIAFGSQTFEVQADKFFPETSSVLIRDLSANGNYMFGVVSAYSGTTLVVDVFNTFGSGTSSAWAIRMMDGPGDFSAADSGSEDWGSITDAAPGSSSGPEDYEYVTYSAGSSDAYGLVTDGSGSTGDYGAI